MAQAEATSTDLEKKMRLLDMNQKAYSEDANTQLKRQAELLTSLSKENDALKAELANSAKHHALAHNIDYANSVGALTEKLEGLDRKLATETSQIASLDEQIADSRKQIHAARRVMGGVNISREQHGVVGKQVTVLENRLDQALVKFNEALAENKELREQIDNLRRERVVFDGIYKKLERELHEKKKQMADIIEQSNLYYEERDMAAHELNALKLAAEKDMMQYEEHFRELDSMLEADKTLKESLRQSQRMKPGGLTKKGPTDEKEGTEEKARRAAKAKENALEESTMAKASAEEAVRQLMEATEIDDVKLLVEKFVNAEEQNFSMYNFVNDLNKEVELLTERITALRSDLDKYKGSGLDGARVQALHDLEDKLAHTERISEDYEEKTLKCEEQIAEIRSAIESLFVKMGCSLEEMGDHLGTTQCTENTMLVFLGAMEQKTTEMLNLFNAATTRKGRKKVSEELDDEDRVEGDTKLSIFSGTGPAVPFGSATVHLPISQLPTTGETFSAEGQDDAEEDKVLTQEELRAQTEARLAAKEEQHAKGRESRKVKPKKKKPTE